MSHLCHGDKDFSQTLLQETGWSSISGDVKEAKAKLGSQISQFDEVLQYLENIKFVYLNKLLTLQKLGGRWSKKTRKCGSGFRVVLLITIIERFLYGASCPDIIKYLKINKTSYFNVKVRTYGVLWNMSSKFLQAFKGKQNSAISCIVENTTDSDLYNFVTFIHQHKCYVR